MRHLARVLSLLGLALSLLLVACEEAENTAPAQPEVAPVADPFVAVSEDVLRERVQAALGRARSGGKKVLLEFVADWCHDCREVVRVASAGPAAEVLASDYEVVYIEVGRFDRHMEFIRRYRVERIATLVVLDGQGERLAQTTLEPLSNNLPLSSEALANWLRHPIDHWQRNDTAQETPVFPAEIVEPESEGSE